jgi:hypothetical protein
MTAREAGTPTRLVRSNALLDGGPFRAIGSNEPIGDGRVKGASRVRTVV